MTPYEAARLAIADGNMLAAIIAALGIWVFGIGMLAQNWRREKADQRRAAQADKDRKAALADAAEDRKVTQGMLMALTELVRRTSPPSSRAGPQPGPAE